MLMRNLEQKREEAIVVGKLGVALMRISVVLFFVTFFYYYVEMIYPGPLDGWDILALVIGALIFVPSLVVVIGLLKKQESL